MTNQELLNNFVAARNGRGRSLNAKSGVCVYFPEDGSPGCAVGCQPGFNQFKGRIREGRSIFGLMNDHFETDLAKEIRDFFGVNGDSKNVQEKETFLRHLQLLHDDSPPWDGLKLRRDSVAEFAKHFGLNVPESDYA